MENTVLHGVKPELELEWLVIYDDGTELKQNYDKGDAGDEHNFGHIDQDRLREFWLVDETGERHFGVNVRTQSIMIGDVQFYVEFPRDKEGHEIDGKLVYFRRIKNDFAPEGITTTVRYCIGLQANIDGRNRQQYLFVNMDGSFTLSQQK